MDFATYKGSLAGDAPPAGLSMAAQALWWEAKGDWHLAHQCAQKQGDAEGAWAHAYLHRVEGDLSNAGGWYARAGRPPSAAPLPQEWETIARALLVEPSPQRVDKPATASNDPLNSKHISTSLQSH